MGWLPGRVRGNPLETLLGGPTGVVTDSGTQKPLNVSLEDGEWKRKGSRSSLPWDMGLIQRASAEPGLEMGKGRSLVVAQRTRVPGTHLTAGWTPWDPQQEHSNK